jgi:hypothetical protein
MAFRVVSRCERDVIECYFIVFLDPWLRLKRLKNRDQTSLSAARFKQKKAVLRYPDLAINPSSVNRIYNRGMHCVFMFMMIFMMLVLLLSIGLQGKLGTSKDADMSPFECARKLLDGSCTRMSITER